MKHIFIEKVDYRKDDLVKGLMNKIDVEFIVNGHQGTATAITDEQLNLKMVFDIEVEGVEREAVQNSAVAFFLGMALRSSLAEFKEAK